MPCKCSGFRVDKCNCKVLGTGYLCQSDGGVTLLTHSKSLCSLLELKSTNKTDTKHNILVRIIEAFYERCAAYNLRYCPIRGFTMRDSYVSNTLKDLLIMVFFLIANFVVFLAISVKMVVHLYYIALWTIQWIRKSLTSKIDINESPVMLRPLDYIQSTSNKYI
ncbi:uncharacterized protein LOC142986710 [Anticarsia gemmatalis]|uniref:uncharacterized protein LOC142986710 n=1 Tax=Anticarsia gemmatalis TaxID=129554 RepID=UPI003F768075